MKDTTALATEHDLNPRVAMGLERALARYFAGAGPKKQCLQEEENCSEGTYYTWRKENPALIQRIEDNARLRGLKHQRGEDIAWESRQKRESHLIQEWAIKALKQNDIKAALIDLALGNPRTITVGDEDKHIVPYPRDQIQALELLQELARGGALPEAKKDSLAFLDRLTEYEEEDRDRGPSLDDFVLGVPTRFSKITAETPDGRKFTAEVTEPNIIEGESYARN